MITVRISFKKRNEASYISLLDLQRVMQRVLKRSGLPVWHTLGFNPHIYMTFACPLSLGQESECECVDVKTEAEAPDFAQWQTALNAIMPTGIEVYRVEPVKMKADAIAYACYRIRYPASAAPLLERAWLPLLAHDALPSTALRHLSGLPSKPLAATRGPAAREPSCAQDHAFHWRAQQPYVASLHKHVNWLLLFDDALRLY